MRIYFVGGESSGKTTLAKMTSQQFQLPMITEVARTILCEKELSLDSLRTNLDVVDEYQTSVFKRQIEEEKKYKSFVSDRSFDNLAYAGQYSRILSYLINLSDTKQYIESLKEKDVVIFFVRPAKECLKQDGMRESLVWENVLRIDSNIKFMLEMWNLPYIQINFSNMQERIRLIESVLKYVI